MEKRNSPRIHEDTWKRYEKIIFHLYVIQNKALTAPGGVKDTMTFKYNFTATKAQYETRLKKWGFHKYRSANNRRATLSNISQGITVNSGIARQPSTLGESGHAQEYPVSRAIPFRTPSPRQQMMQPDQPIFPSLVLSSVLNAVDTDQQLTSELDLGLVPIQQRGRVSINCPHTDDPVDSMWYGHHEADAVASIHSSAILASSQSNNSAVFPGKTLADDFDGWNHIRSTSFRGTLAGYPLVETSLSGNLFITSFVDALMPMVSQLARTAIPSAHMALSMGRALFQSAIGSALQSRSSPHTLQLIRQQTVEYQIIYIIIHRLINDSAIGVALAKPNTPLDKLLRAGIEHILAMGAQFLGTMVDSVPALYKRALIQGLFLAALVMGNSSVLRILLGRTNLATQALFLSDSKEYPLEYACRRKDLVAIEILLIHGANPNIYAQQAPTADLFNYRKGHEEHNTTDIRILGLLLQYRLLESEYHHVRILECCSKEELIWLVAHDLDLASLLFLQEAMLPLLLLRTDWDGDLSAMFEMFLKRGNMDATIPCDLWKDILLDSLHTAVLLRHRSEVMMLLEMGTEPDTRCLISATICEDLENLRRFLDMGIDPNTPVQVYSENGGTFSTALSVSIAHGSPELFTILEERECIHKLTRSPDGIIPALVAACQTGNTGVVGRLLALQNIPVSWERMLAYSGHTEDLERAFNIAIEAGYENICHQLLSGGFRPMSRCLDTAYRSGRPELIEILTNIVDPTARTFCVAMNKGTKKDLEELLHRGVPLDERLELNDDDIDRSEFTALFPFYQSYETTLLGAAIMAQRAVAVEVLLTHGARVNSPNGYDGRFVLLTALTASVIKRNTPLLIELLGEGADPFDNSAIYVAAVYGLDDVIELLLLEFKHRYPRGSTSFGQTALLWVIHVGNIHLTETLVKVVSTCGLVDAQSLASGEKDSSLSSERFRSGQSLLRTPAIRPASKLSIPPPPRTRPPFCQSPLRAAFGSLRLYLTSPIGEAIRMDCAKDCSIQVLHLILPWIKDLNGIVVEDAEIGNLTGILYAIRLDSLKTVQKLVKAGADLSFPARSSVNRTALQTATEVENKEIVEYLLAQHVDPNEPPAARSGATSLQIAAIKGYVGIASILINAGAKINAEPALLHGRRAFEGATEHGRIEMMVFLVQHGADLLSNDKQQYRRAVQFARENGQPAAMLLADELLKKALESQRASDRGVEERGKSPGTSEFGTDRSVWSVSEFLNADLDVGF